MHGTGNKSKRSNKVFHLQDVNGHLFSSVLCLSALCLSPKPGFESGSRHVRKLPVT